MTSRPASKFPLHLAAVQQPSFPSPAPQDGRLSPQQLRAMMISEFEQWLRSRTNQEKRPFHEETVVARPRPAQRDPQPRWIHRACPDDRRRHQRAAVLDHAARPRHLLRRADRHPDGHLVVLARPALKQRHGRPHCAPATRGRRHLHHPRWRPPDGFLLAPDSGRRTPTATPGWHRAVGRQVPASNSITGANRSANWALTEM
jgi:hypothetical protein